MKKNPTPRRSTRIALDEDFPRDSDPRTPSIPPGEVDDEDVVIERASGSGARSGRKAGGG